MRLLLTALVAVVLGGCAVQNPQRAADIAKCRSYGYVENWRVVDCINDEAEKRRQADRQAEIASQDDAMCRQAGLNPGTDQYMKCRAMIEQNRRERAAMVFGATPPSTSCYFVGNVMRCN